ncbi:MAG: NFACT family protein [Solirubrobacterales bacterium]
MAFDGIFIYSVVNEIKNLLINGKVEKVSQPERDEVVLTVKNNRTTYKLSLSASSVYPKILLTEISKTNPTSAPMYCMVLRKYLLGSRILDIRQLASDRVVFIDFMSLDELGYDSIYTLAVEIMGKHSNITLIRDRDKIIMDSIKHITPDMSSLRTLLPGMKYVNPPESSKLNPLEFNQEEFNDFIAKNQVQFNSNFFSTVFTGISKTLSKEISYRLEKNHIAFNQSMELFNFTLDFFNMVKKCDFYYSLYSKDSIVNEFHCIELLHLCEYEKTAFDSASKLVDLFYYEKDKTDRLKNKSSDLHKLININLERCQKKIHLLEETLKDCSSKETFKITGELLTSNIYNIKQGDTEIEVFDYYNNEYVKIKLDKEKSPSQNVQFYYKKYNKLKKSEEASKQQIENAKEEYEYLQSVLTNIENADSYEEIEEIKRELTDTGYIRFKKNTNKKVKQTKPMHFISKDNIDIYVGKNNIQNDYLTLKFADKHDIWLHTKNIPGSHVIIKHFGIPPEGTLLEAANLAAWYSKGKNSTKVPVDYTEVKNVKKPNGAKPGMVIYSTNKTIYVDPKKPD